MWFLFGLLGFTALAGAMWVVTQIPLPSEAPLAQTTLIYDADGRQMAELHGVENRFPVKLEQVPPITQEAVIAAEDRHFLEHRGVDPWSIARATWADLRRQGATQGGSTITQQYVKNQFVGSERTLVRKLKEAVVAIKLERKYDKPTILEKYLNTVYFGRGAYGIQAAAKTYFDKDVGQLDLKESAYLAGLIRTPSSGDVFTDPDTAHFLRTAVLDSMVRNQIIAQEEADAVHAVRIESYVFRPEVADTTFTNTPDGAEYFVELVRQELVRTYGEDRVLRGGLRVTTTLNSKMQTFAYRAVYDTLPADTDPEAALVSLDREGRVVAMVGGRNWSASKVNLAAGLEGGGGGRQGGSAFKPFVLAEAIRQGMSVTDKYFPAPAKIGPLPGWEDEVKNYNDAAFGYVNLVDATVNSVNTVYAQLVGEVGPAKVVDMAKGLGIRSELNAYPSIALGTQNVSVLEMANAYLTLANDGMRRDPRVIAKVEEGGVVLQDDRPRGRVRAVEASVARQVRDVLTEVVTRGSGIQAQLPGGAWGKTGTTDEYGDAWFVGGNEELVTGVWMGYPEGQSRSLYNVRGVAKVAGGTLPAYIFKAFMFEAAPGDASNAPKPKFDPGALNQTSTPWDTTAPAGSSSAGSSRADDTDGLGSPVTTEPSSSVSTTTLPRAVVEAPTVTQPAPNDDDDDDGAGNVTPTTSRSTPSIPRRPTVTFPPGFPTN